MISGSLLLLVATAQAIDLEVVEQSLVSESLAGTTDDSGKFRFT